MGATMRVVFSVRLHFSFQLPWRLVGSCFGSATPVIRQGFVAILAQAQAFVCVFLLRVFRSLLCLGNPHAVHAAQGMEFHRHTKWLVRGHPWTTPAFSPMASRTQGKRQGKGKEKPVAVEETDFGQSRFGHPDLTNYGQSISGSGVCHGPKGWGPNPGGAPKGGAPKGGRHKISLFFFPLPPPFRSLCVSCLKRRGLKCARFWSFTRQPESPNVHI